MTTTVLKNLLKILIFVPVGIFSFTNCTQGNPPPKAGLSVEAGLLQNIQSEQTPSCSFNGQPVAEGESVVAYLESSVDPDTICRAEQRVCTNGVLSGSHEYATCGLAVPRSCLFNGLTIPHEGTVTAYLNSILDGGETCQSEIRTCNDGTLSGEFEHASCRENPVDPEPPASCMFNDQVILHGQTVKAYQNASPNVGTGCVTEDRLCQDGVLSGSYTNASCTELSCQPLSFASCGYLDNGAFVKQCNAAGTDYGACTQTCNSGYVMVEGQCLQQVNECPGPGSETRNCTYMHDSGHSGYFPVAYRQSCRVDGRWIPENSVFPLFHLTDCSGAWAGPYENSRGVGLRNNGTPLPW